MSRSGRSLVINKSHSVGSSTDVVQDIKRGMNDVEEVYKQCEELSDIISPLKEVNRRYQQVM